MSSSRVVLVVCALCAACADGEPRDMSSDELQDPLIGAWVDLGKGGERAVYFHGFLESDRLRFVDDEIPVFPPVTYKWTRISGTRIRVETTTGGLHEVDLTLTPDRNQLTLSLPDVVNLTRVQYAVLRDGGPP